MPTSLVTYCAAGSRRELADTFFDAVMGSLYRPIMSETLPVFTIGHSTRTIPEFVDLLRAGGVQLVVDVRSILRSRTNPQYNLDALPGSLTAWQIGHTQIPELGGLRKKSETVSPDTNNYWVNRSFHNYADYALSDEFHSGLTRLLELSGDRRCAIMCSEAVWWRCHRRIVADYLMLSGRMVCHLMGGGRVEPAKLTPAAVADGSALTYPAEALKEQAHTLNDQRQPLILRHDGAFGRPKIRSS